MSEYEKKYKAALAAGRELIKQHRQVVLAIFPELKESQDERIRQTLIDYFMTYKQQETEGITTFFGIPTDDILAYLEKLKIFTEHGEGLYHFVNNEFTYVGDNKIVNSCSAPKETVCEACMRSQPGASCSDVTVLGRCALEHSKPVTKLL